MFVTTRTIVEIAVHSVESAIAAQVGGADRVELFSNPIEGGVTPSEGLITILREKLVKDLHVMIRPRGGDFHYSELESEVMRRDINMAKRSGANGVVFGFVNVDGTVDVERTRQMVEASRPLSVTFHRAFDVCSNLENALEDLISSGVDRVLTSGGEASAIEGSKRIASLVRIAGNRIKIIAAGGIRPANVRRILQETGVREVHAGLRSTIPGPMRFHNEKVSIGHRIPGEHERIVVKEDDVRKLVNAVGQL
ncbi:MAG TPA: copper homeostasis protein CutC [Terriglobales bacterium]|jgi:copper homeostasis protein|nr:copper homeostasis protein CutC [Terriglobales bacterium]